MVLNEKYDFLKKIELSELKGKEDDFVIFKGIKFNKDERELLQFIQWKGEKFSNYVKYLIEKDMRETIEDSNNMIKANNTASTLQLDDEHLMSLIEKVLEVKENKIGVSKETLATEIKEEDKKAIGALGTLGIKKR